MKQQQKVLECQMLLSSHLVQLVWYRVYVEALIHVQMLPLPPPPLLPSESHVQVDPPDPILSRVRPPSPSPASLTMPEPIEAQHVDPTSKEPYVDQSPEAYISQHAEAYASPMLSRV